MAHRTELGSEDGERESADEALLDALLRRSGGNALYATYLCREVRRAPAVVEPAEVVEGLPQFDGTLHDYYEHLRTSLGEGIWVADVIALLDAPVTPAELMEIAPQLGHRVGSALDVLAPVLRVRPAGGAVRIYHESFARYLREGFQGHPDALAAQIGIIADWLEGRGVFTDERAFRLLLGMLNEAGRPSDVLRLVDQDFVANAVGAGFPARLVRVNLAAGVRAASALGDWRAATRCVELARAAATFQFERFESTLVNFIDVAAEAVGAQTLANRLLDDDRPAVPGRAGLLMCAALDAVGAVVPWSEYLEAFHYEHDDVAYGHDSDRAVQEAVLRGRLRLSSTTLSKNIGEEDWRSAPVDLANVAEWIDDGAVGPASAVRSILETVDVDSVVDLGAACSRPAAVWIALAEELAAGAALPPDFPSARMWAIAAVGHGVRSGSAHRLIRLGVPVDLLSVDAAAARSQLLRLTRGVQTTMQDGVEERWRSEWVPAWSDQVLLAAHLDTIGLDAAEAMVDGQGWYPCFLRCAIGVARAEAAPTADQSRLALGALRMLTEDTGRFTGAPRACDLYPVEGTIKSTIRRAVDLLEESDWEEAVRLIVAVGDEVNTTMRGEMGGPLPVDWILKMIVATAPDHALSVARELVVHQIEEGSGGRFYADLAEFRLFAGRVALRAGDTTELARRWREASWLLCSYGFHKDITVYDLLDPLPALIAADPKQGRMRVQQVQGLCERLPMHTDGKETNWAPSRWWACLAEADPVSAVALAAPQLLEAVNQDYSRIRAAIDDVWDHWGHDADPLVAACLRLAIDPPLTEMDEGALTRLVGTPDIDASSLHEVARLLVARADERASRYSVSNSDELVIQDIQKVRVVNRGAVTAGVDESDEGITAPHASLPAKPPLPDYRELVARLDQGLGLTDPPVPAGPVGIIRAASAWRRHGLDRRDDLHVDHYADVVGYRLVELLQEGHTADAAAALRRVVALHNFGQGAGLLSAVADGLLRLGWSDLAAQAYALHWTRTRGSGGWLTFGGESALESLREACRLAPQTARDVVMEEVELLVEGGREYGLAGLTQALVLAHVKGALGEAGHGVAFDVWDEAFAVIEARAPWTDASDDPDRAYVAPASDPGTAVVGDLNEAFAYATVSGLASPERAAKRRALLATRLLLVHRPALAGAAIALALGNLEDPGTVAWLLALVMDVRAPKDVVNACHAELVRLGRSDHLTVRALARELLPAEDRPALGPSDPSLVALGGDLSPRETMRRVGVNMVHAVGIQAGDRIDAVESALPGLGAAVVREATLRIEPQIQQFKRQVRGLGYTSDEEEWPDGVTLLEQTIETVLQELATAGRGLAFVAGDPIDDPESWEHQLAHELLDGPMLPIALEASRYPRPVLPVPGSPATAAMAASAAPSVQATSVRVGPGMTWPIVASFERLHPRPSRYYSSTEVDALRAQGLELRMVAGGKRASADHPPLAIGSIERWLSPLASNVRAPTMGDVPLFGFEHDPGPGSARLGLGLPPVLITPTPLLVDLLGLRPTRGFMMEDERGPALALVTWRAGHARSDYHLPYPSLVGSAAAIRPDLLQALNDRRGSVLRSRVVDEAIAPQERVRHLSRIRQDSSCSTAFREGAWVGQSFPRHDCRLGSRPI